MGGKDFVEGLQRGVLYKLTTGRMKTPSLRVLGCSYSRGHLVGYLGDR